MSEETVSFRWQSAVIVLVASLALISWFVLHSRWHTLKLKAYFTDAGGLKPGDAVNMAGVNVGTVTSVRVRPELHDHPAEVEMELQTTYKLTVPNDAIVSVEMAGILGGSFAAIDTKAATGPPAHNNDTLKTTPSQSHSAQQTLDCLSNLAKHQPCDLVHDK
jgi:phospholipid/cholesterol/gamma-HCH transport system substrate-binding protein